MSKPDVQASIELKNWIHDDIILLFPNISKGVLINRINKSTSFEPELKNMKRSDGTHCNHTFDYTIYRAVYSNYITRYPNSIRCYIAE